MNNKMRQNSLLSKTHALFLFAKQTCSKRLRYVDTHLCVFPFFSSPPSVQLDTKKDIASAGVSRHVVPFGSSGSRKVSAGWNLGPRVPSLDCTIHNTQNLGVFALPSSLKSLPAGLVLSCRVIWRIFTSGGRSLVIVETWICLAMENGHERGLCRIKRACTETNVSWCANSK